MGFKKPFRAVPIKEGKAHRRRRKRENARHAVRSGLPLAIIGLLLGIGIGLLVLFWPTETVYADGSFKCQFPQVTDGDTIRCVSKRVRLDGIDAPEMPGHCPHWKDCAPGDPYASKANLQSLIGWFPDLRCRQTDIDRYGRIVARCKIDGVDLSCRQLADGQAIRRYGDISC